MKLHRTIPLSFSSISPAKSVNKSTAPGIDYWHSPFFHPNSLYI